MLDLSAECLAIAAELRDKGLLVLEEALLRGAFEFQQNPATDPDDLFLIAARSMLLDHE